MGGRVAAQDHYWFGWTDIPANMICEPVRDGKLGEDRCKQDKKCSICYAVSTLRSMSYEYKTQDRTLDMLCTEVEKDNVKEYNTQENLGPQEMDFMKSLWHMYTTNENAGSGRRCPNGVRCGCM